MKLTLKKLNQSGFDHVVFIVAFVVLIGIIGTAAAVLTHADTPQPTLRFLSTAGLCLNELPGGKISVSSCNGNVGQKSSISFGPTKNENGMLMRTGVIKLNAGCVGVSGASTGKSGINSSLDVRSCNPIPWGGDWYIAGNNTSGYTFSNVHAGSNYCMDNTGSSFILSAGGCDQWWFTTSGTTTTISTSGYSTDCHDYEYSTADENWYIPCVADIQTLLKLSATDFVAKSDTSFYHYSPPSVIEASNFVDGYYGESTMDQVQNFQASPPPVEGGPDGIVGKFTWQALCAESHAGYFLKHKQITQAIYNDACV